MIIIRKNKFNEEVERFDPRDVPVRRIRRSLAKKCAKETQKHLKDVWPCFRRSHKKWTTPERLHEIHMKHLEYMKKTGGK